MVIAGPYNHWFQMTPLLGWPLQCLLGYQKDKFLQVEILVRSSQASKAATKMTHKQIWEDIKEDGSGAAVRIKEARLRLGRQ